MRLPLGLRPEQWDNLCAMGREHGVEFDPLMSADQLAGAIRTKGGPAIPGQITPRALYDALKRIPAAHEGEAVEFTEEQEATMRARTEAAQQTALVDGGR